MSSHELKRKLEKKKWKKKKVPQSLPISIASCPWMCWRVTCYRGGYRILKRGMDKERTIRYFRGKGRLSSRRRPVDCTRWNGSRLAQCALVHGWSRKTKVNQSFKNAHCATKNLAVRIKTRFYTDMQVYLWPLAIYYFIWLLINEEMETDLFYFTFDRIFVFLL